LLPKRNLNPRFSTKGDDICFRLSTKKWYDVPPPFGFLWILTELRLGRIEARFRPSSKIELRLDAELIRQKAFKGMKVGN
jgi:hypothetical protein